MGYLALSRNTFDCNNWKINAIFIQWRYGVLLTILQCTGQHPQWRVILLKMSTTVSFKNLAIDVEKSCSNGMTFLRSQNDAQGIQQCFLTLASQNPNIFYHYVISRISIQLSLSQNFFLPGPKESVPEYVQLKIQTITHFWGSSSV